MSEGGSYQRVGKRHGSSIRAIYITESSDARDLRRSTASEKRCPIPAEFKMNSSEAYLFPDSVMTTRHPRAGWNLMGCNPCVIGRCRYEPPSTPNPNFGVTGGVHPRSLTSADLKPSRMWLPSDSRIVCSKIPAIYVTELACRFGHRSTHG